MSRRATASPLAATAALPVLAAAAHVLPAGTWLARPRRALFPGLAGAGRPDHVALTFDDGPDPESTPAFLAVLDHLDVRATFFVLGERLARAQDLGREIVERGHELAVHGWTHNRPWRPSPRREARRMEDAVRIVGEVAGALPAWYRPPYGILTGDRALAAHGAGLRTVLWSAWGRDWTPTATPESVLSTVLADLRGGGTVLLHDTDRMSAPDCWHATLGALPPLAAACRASGLDLGPLRDHGVGSGPARGKAAWGPPVTPAA